MIKKYRWVLIFALIVLVGIFLFFYRLYQHDLKALGDFMSSYQKFDIAISDFQGASVTDDIKRTADAALGELSAKASVRISSVIKHDGDVMSTEREIADVSKKELDALISYKKAVQENRAVDSDRLAKEFSDLHAKRITEYAYFQALGK